MGREASNWFHVVSCQREHAALEAELAAIGKRQPWLWGVGLVGLFGSARLWGGGEVAAEFRHDFGEVGAQAVVLALLVGGIWLLRDYIRDKKARSRAHALYLELCALGCAYDFTARKWTEPDAPPA